MKAPFHLRAEYREYCEECIGKGEEPLPFREYIWIAYHYEYLDSL
jgi:hypothetical protein